jgi:hypothetical protein
LRDRKLKKRQETEGKRVKEIRSASIRPENTGSELLSPLARYEQPQQIGQGTSLTITFRILLRPRTRPRELTFRPARETSIKSPAAYTAAAIHPLPSYVGLRPIHIWLCRAVLIHEPECRFPSLALCRTAIFNSAIPRQLNPFDTLLLDGRASLCVRTSPTAAGN